MNNTKREIKASIMGPSIKTSWVQIGNKRYPSLDDVPEDLRTAVALGDIPLGRGSTWKRVKPADLEATATPESRATTENIINQIYGEN